MNKPMIGNNIWELAEAWIAGTLPEEERVAVQIMLETDNVFAAEFNESVDLLQSLNNKRKQVRFRSMLGDIHEHGKKRTLLQRIRTIELPANLWKISAMAAGVALLASFVTNSLFVNSVNKRNTSQYNTISREVEHLKNVQKRQQEQQKAIIDSINKKTIHLAPPSEVRYTGTGFALSNDGYFVTAYHVINDGKGDCDSVYIQSNDGIYYKATLINYSKQTDLAILKVEKKNFRFAKGEVPYTLSSSKTNLGSAIFTLGYPHNEIVYSEGYISARNGYNGNERQYTLELPAGHGQSGSPVIDARGNLVGVLTAIGTPQESNTYAVSSQALLDLIHTLPDEKSLHLNKTSKLNRQSREEQIQTMENYTFSVKVYKK